MSNLMGTLDSYFGQYAEHLRQKESAARAGKAMKNLEQAWLGKRVEVEAKRWFILPPGVRLEIPEGDAISSCITILGWEPLFPSRKWVEGRIMGILSSPLVLLNGQATDAMPGVVIQDESDPAQAVFLLVLREDILQTKEVAMSGL